MTPPDRVSEPVSLSGAPMASMSKPSPRATPVDPGRAGRAGHDVPGHDPDVADGDRLRAGVAQLVEELLDAGPVDRAADDDRRHPGRSTGSRPA